MSLTSYRAAPPRVKAYIPAHGLIGFVPGLTFQDVCDCEEGFWGGWFGSLSSGIEGLAATYSPAP